MHTIPGELADTRDEFEGMMHAVNAGKVRGIQDTRFWRELTVSGVRA